MLTVDEARAAIQRALAPLPDEQVAIVGALGRVLAEDVVAAHDLPRFDNSAMDGFAVRADDRGDRRVAGESRAGAPAAVAVDPGEAVRISTGAALPTGADAIVPVERAREHDGGIAVEGDVAAGDHVRRAGEDVRAGAIVLAARTRLGPVELGAAIAAGRATVRCGATARVAVLGTGDELVAPGEPLAPGQVHDSNTAVLSALAARDGAHVVLRRTAGDDLGATREDLAEALDAADLVIVSGGVSVGPHDHVKPALRALGVTERFWRVALQPGKPTWFGTRGETAVLGLPGNPVSSLVTYVLFARMALAALQGDAPPARRRATLAHGVARRPDRDRAIHMRFDIVRN